MYNDKTMYDCINNMSASTVVLLLTSSNKSKSMSICL